MYINCGNKMITNDISIDDLVLKVIGLEFNGFTFRLYLLALLIQCIELFYDKAEAFAFGAVFAQYLKRVCGWSISEDYFGDEYLKLGNY